jgi:hypothetical protein
MVVCLGVPLLAVLIVPLVLGLWLRFTFVGVGAILLFFGGMSYAGFLERILPSPRGLAFNHGAVQLVLMFVYGVILALMWFVIGSAVCGVTVYIDNATNERFVVAINGQDRAILGGGTTLWDSWRYGNHEVTVKDSNGQVRDTFQVSITKEGPWVLNLMGAGRYTRGGVSYGNASSGDWSTPVTDRWFEANVNCLFEDPPKSIRTKGGGGTRTFLVRNFAVQKLVK